MVKCHLSELTLQKGCVLPAGVELGWNSLPQYGLLQLDDPFPVETISYSGFSLYQFPSSGEAG